MDAFYTKAKPKVVDYNPLTHMSFYNQMPPPATYSPNPQKNITLSTYLDTPSKYPRSTSLAGKNIFSQTGNYTNRSPSIEKLSGNVTGDSPRYYKTRPKNKIADPISGEIKFFNIDRPRLENLDISHHKDKLTNDLDFDSVRRFHQQKGLLKSVDNIAGSLKKEVPYVPYVDPFILKRSLPNS